MFDESSYPYNTNTSVLDNTLDPLRRRDEIESLLDFFGDKGSVELTIENASDEEVEIVDECVVGIAGETEVTRVEIEVTPPVLVHGLETVEIPHEEDLMLTLENDEESTTQTTALDHSPFVSRPNVTRPPEKRQVKQPEKFKDYVMYNS